MEAWCGATLWMRSPIEYVILSNFERTETLTTVGVSLTFCEGEFCNIYTRNHSRLFGLRSSPKWKLNASFGHRALLSVQIASRCVFQEPRPMGTALSNQTYNYEVTMQQNANTSYIQGSGASTLPLSFLPDFQLSLASSHV